MKTRLTQFAVVVLAVFLIHSRIAQSADGPWAGRTAYIPKLEKNLKENIAAFWLSKSLDLANGGYTINFGPKGESKGPGTKMIVTQARTVWLFSRLVRAGYGGPEHLQAAEHGYRFLKEKMWDTKNGGFYWEVDATGNERLKPRKHLYGQAFGLYALSEYYLASEKKEVLDFTTRLFNVLESKSHDKTYAGYLEFFNEDWASTSQRNPVYGRGHVGAQVDEYTLAFVGGDDDILPRKQITSGTRETSGVDRH